MQVISPYLFLIKPIDFFVFTTNKSQVNNLQIAAATGVRFLSKNMWCWISPRYVTGNVNVDWTNCFDKH